MKKEKSKSLSWYDGKLWEVFSVFIRLRFTDSKGYGRCFTCDRKIHWTNGDAGHGIPRQHKGTKFNECNNHLQCKVCNGFEGGKREVYKVRMDAMYGQGTWDKMELAKNKTCKRGKFELSQMIEHYKGEIIILVSSKSLDEVSLKKVDKVLKIKSN